MMDDDHTQPDAPARDIEQAAAAEAQPNDADTPAVPPELLEDREGGAPELRPDQTEGGGIPQAS